MRIQFALGNVLQAEVIVEDFQAACKLSSDFARAKLKVGSSAGATVVQRADKSRTWDVPVGSEIP